MTQSLIVLSFSPQPELLYFFQCLASVNNSSFPDTCPSQPFECSSLCFFISRDPQFSGLLSPSSVHLLTLFLLP